MTDKIGHWLQGGALIAAILALVYAARKGVASPGEAAASYAPLTSPQAIQFGGAVGGAVVPDSTFNIGGSPVYLTYNMPNAIQGTDPANAGGVAAASTNPVEVPASNPAPQAPSCCNNCPQTQLTLGQVGASISRATPQAVNNLLSLVNKQAIAIG